VQIRRESTRDVVSGMLLNVVVTFQTPEDVFAMFSRVELQLEKKTKGASDHNLSSQQLKENENFLFGTNTIKYMKDDLDRAWKLLSA
jgi:hypothetical protein